MPDTIIRGRWTVDEKTGQVIELEPREKIVVEEPKIELHTGVYL